MRIVARRTIARALAVITLLNLAACTVAEVSNDDSAEIVHTMLGIPVDKYRDDNGYNALAAYRGWGELYARYLSAARDDGRLDDVKLYLLLGFVAQLKGQAATSEALSSDLHGVFVSHSDTVLEALKQNPYLVASTCYYLGNYFGFESRNAQARPQFIATYEAKIRKGLRTGGGEQCMTQIRSPERLPM